MDDVVQFKTYTYWKDQVKPEVRRFGIEKSVVKSFVYIEAKLQEVYPGLKQKRFTVSWRDEDGDDVAISSDEEMIIALTAMSENLMKLNVYCKDKEPSKLIDRDSKKTASIDAVGDKNVHYNVICDNCDGSIKGFRYKCTSCADFDLCSNCEFAGHHAEHIMLRLPISTHMPHSSIRSAIKQTRAIMKAYSSEQTCPQKKQIHNKSNEKRRHHGETKSADHYQNHSFASYLKTFTTYMNEFANLAGDVDIDISKIKVEKDIENIKAENPKSAYTECKKTPMESMECKKSSTSDNIQTGEQPQPTASNDKVYQYLKIFNMDDKKIQNLMNDSELNNILTNLLQSWEPINVENKNNNDSVEKVAGADKHVTPSTKKEIINDKKEESPERAPNDWIVINQEKDLMESDNKPSIQLESPNEFKLPEDFQKYVNVSEGQSLYPPLHTASAVLNPKELEQMTSQGPAEPKVIETVKQKITRPNSQAKPQAQESQPAHTYHHKVHIDAAVKQMLSMGFTNEGNHLTQLLESTDGNIPAVLDLLTIGKP